MPFVRAMCYRRCVKVVVRAIGQRTACEGCVSRAQLLPALSRQLEHVWMSLIDLENARQTYVQTKDTFCVYHEQFILEGYDRSCNDNE